MTTITTGMRVLKETRNARYIEVSFSLDSLWEGHCSPSYTAAILHDNGAVVLHQASSDYSSAQKEGVTIVLSPKEFADLVSAVTAYLAEVEARGGPAAAPADDEDGGEDDGEGDNDRDNDPW